MFKVGTGFYDFTPFKLAQNVSGVCDRGGQSDKLWIMQSYFKSCLVRLELLRWNNLLDGAIGIVNQLVHTNRPPVPFLEAVLVGFRVVFEKQIGGVIKQIPLAFEFGYRSMVCAAIHFI